MTGTGGHGAARLAWVAVVSMLGGAPCARAGPEEAEASASRRAIIAALQEAKAEGAESWRAGRIERWVNSLEEALASGRIGWHPWLVSGHAGGGLALGAGWGRHVSDYSYVDLRASLSVRGYKRLEGELRSPRLFDRRAVLSLVGGWREAGQVGFYGFGTGETDEADRANFGFRQSWLAASLEGRPVRRLLVLGGGLEHTRWAQRPGSGSWPPVEEKYDPDTLPGLGTRTGYVHVQGRIALDWRPAPGYARRGGSYGTTWHLHHDPDRARSFRQVDCEIIQHWPVLRETWVLSGRARVQSTDTAAGRVIPFYMLPWLGGGSSLRGFRTGRFRDRHTLLLQAEWRIPLNRFLDMAVFYDAGKAVARRRELDLDGLKSDWGLGFRFHGPLSTPLRIEVARSNERTALVLSSHAPF